MNTGKRVLKPEATKKAPKSMEFRITQNADAFFSHGGISEL